MIRYFLPASLAATLLFASIVTSAARPFNALPVDTSLPSVAGRTIRDISMNQASLAFAESPAAGIVYYSRFGISELAVKRADVVMPFRDRGAFSLSLTNYGFEEYSYSSLTGSGGMQISESLLLGVGIGVERIRTAMTEKGYNAATASIGMIYMPSSSARVALHLVNPIPGKLRNEPQLSAIRTGVEGDIGDRLTLSVMAEKREHEPLSLIAGFRYSPTDPVTISAGHNTDTGAFGFALCWRFGNNDAALSFLSHNRLGISTAVSIYRLFGRR